MTREPTSSTYRVGSIAVEVTSAVARVHEELAAFYDRSYAEPRWRVAAELRDAGPGGIAVDAPRRAVEAAAQHPIDLAVAARRALRDLWLAELEPARYGILHASAVWSGGRVLVFAGASSSGKTTLALDAVLRRGYRLLSNDHLVLVPAGDGVALTTVPTYVPVKRWTYERFAAEIAGVDAVPDHDDPSDPERYVTFRGLGQDPVPHVRPDPGGVEVFMVRFGERPAPPMPLDDPVTALAECHRGDWYAQDRPVLAAAGGARTVEEFVGDTRAACARLLDGARAYRWQHGGAIAAT